MPKTGLSAVLSDRKDPKDKWELEELPLPETEDDGILIRVQATGICGSDLHVWRGDGKNPEDPEEEPKTLGHEMMGTVYKMGKNIKFDSLRNPLKEGDRVIFPYFFPCMSCYNCIRGEFGACKFRSRKTYNEWKYCNSGFSQYYYLKPPHFIFHAPEDLSNNSLVALNCALAQVIEVFNVAKIDFGDNVVIQGAGGLGIYATSVAREMGANKVIVIDGQKSRLELARKCGASDTININEIPTPEERINLVKELTDSIGADSVIELVGFPSVLEEGIKMCRMRGKYLEVGSITINNMINLDANYLVSNQIKFLSFQHYDPWVIPNAVKFLQRTKNKYPLSNLISHQFPLEDINNAFQKSDWTSKNQNSEITRAIINP